MANLTQWVNALDARQFAEALTAMVAARRIVVIGIATPIRRRIYASSAAEPAARCWCCPSRVRVSAKSWSI